MGNTEEHAMLIEAIPADMWPGQQDARPADPAERKSLRADVAHFLRGRFAQFLRGRFEIVGDRLFVIPPDGRFVLLPEPFQLGGPSQFRSPCLSPRGTTN